MSILTNARDSIVMGLEDYSSSEPKRLISCTRNLFAGILLLFKHKLNLLSPPNSKEALIKERVLPKLDASGNVEWVGHGRRTVDVRLIKERFDSLGISVHWNRVDAINNFRNDIEHYYTQLSKDAMRDLVSNSFLIIRDFLSLHLGIDPKQFLGEEAWNTLISVSEVYEQEKAECIRLIESIQCGSDALRSALISFKCTNCGSALITIRNPNPDKYDNEFSCRSCDTSWDFEAIAEQAIENHFEFEEYLSYTDGNDLPTIQCPECLHNTYIVEEQYCVICEASVEHVCQSCGMNIPPEEIDGSGLCSWCAHMLSKDD